MITAALALEQGRDVFAVPGNIDAPSCRGSNGLLREGASPAMSGWDVMSCYAGLFPDKVKPPKDVKLRPSLPRAAKSGPAASACGTTPKKKRRRHRRMRQKK